MSKGPLLNISTNEFAKHIIHTCDASYKYTAAVEDALERYADYITQRVMSCNLTEYDKLIWLRENEWSGL